MKDLTAKRERFCQEIVIGQKLSDAYQVAFKPKKMSKKTINEKACRLAKLGKIRARVDELRAPVVARVQGTMADRLTELSYAVRLDPADCFDEHGRLLSIREMPEQVRRALAGFKVDPVSFITEVKFADKLGAVRLYSQLAGDIPREKGSVAPPRRSRYDLSRLSDEELREHMRLRKKVMVYADDGEREDT